MSLRTAILPLHALGHETRWRILELLLKRAMCGHEIVAALQLPQSTAAGHLAVLKEAGVVVAERIGRETHHAIADRFRALVVQSRRHCGISEETDARLGRDAWNAAQVGG